MAVMKDSGTFLPRDNAVTKRSTPDEIRQRLRLGTVATAMLYVNHKNRQIPKSLTDTPASEIQ